MRRILILVVGILAIANISHPVQAASGEKQVTPPLVCKCMPSVAALDAGFQLAGVGRLGSKYPHLPRIGLDSAMVPPIILKAVAWTESSWEQFSSQSVPLVSPDFGYGLMQITQGMAGAFGNVTGTLPLSTQARIGGDYLLNIAYGARMLAQLFKTSPTVNDRDPTMLEDWYYALWAYNGWGWANNPNNPAFTRQGTPATDPAAFPYQERIYYWIEHPPLDAVGRQLWKPMKVDLPNASSIGTDPAHIFTRASHQELPHLYGATYDVPSGLSAMHAGSTIAVHLTVYNASGIPWGSTMGYPYGLAYHWVQLGHKDSKNYNSNLGGVDVLDGTPEDLTRKVPIAGRIRMKVKVKAPSTPGNYTLEWDMWSSKGGWFSNSSVPTGDQDVDVVPDGEYVPPYVDPGGPHFLTGDHAWLVTPISDGIPSALKPNEPYSETVLLFNPGGRAWTSAYRLHRNGSSTSIALPMKYVAPCRTLPVTLGGRAPAKAGQYTYVWHLETPSGISFGAAMSVSFAVSKSIAVWRGFIHGS